MYVAVLRTLTATSWDESSLVLSWEDSVGAGSIVACDCCCASSPPTATAAGEARRPWPRNRSPLLPFSRRREISASLRGCCTCPTSCCLDLCCWRVTKKPPAGALAPLKDKESSAAVQAIHAVRSIMMSEPRAIAAAKLPSSTSVCYLLSAATILLYSMLNTLAGAEQAVR